MDSGPVDSRAPGDAPDGDGSAPLESFEVDPSEMEASKRVHHRAFAIDPEQERLVRQEIAFELSASDFLKTYTSDHVAVSLWSDGPIRLEDNDDPSGAKCARTGNGRGVALGHLQALSACSGGASDIFVAIEQFGDMQGLLQCENLGTVDSLSWPLQVRVSTDESGTTSYTVSESQSSGSDGGAGNVLASNEAQIIDENCHARNRDVWWAVTPCTHATNKCRDVDPSAPSAPIRVTLEERNYETGSADSRRPAVHRWYRDAPSSEKTMTDHAYTGCGDVPTETGGWVSENAPGFGARRPVSGAVPLYELVYSDSSELDHFYTIDMSAVSNAKSQGYCLQGIAGYVYDSQASNRNEFYRLFNSEIRDHFYTTDANQKSTALNNGYIDEGSEGWLAKRP